ncbi:MAG: hypothetical protein MRY57_03205 [Candidatus Pacebacteria bacterium]|nr:hypothetical protein [Candidatus Paceibacterota bacterium]
MKKRITFNMQILKKLKTEFNYRLHLDWKKGDFGCIEFDNGVKHYITRGDIRVNRIGPYMLAGNKHYTDAFLKKNKYPIIKSDVFYSEDYCADNGIDKGIVEAIQFGNKLSYPLIVKPNEGLQGNGVERVDDEKSLKKALFKLFKNYDKVLVQKFFTGDDYRILVYNNKFISAYRRMPLTVTGDGGSNIQELLDERIVEYQDSSRKFALDIQKIKSVLKRQKKSLKTIPERGERVCLLDNANLSAGGYAEDVSDIIHDDYKTAAIKAAADLGLRLCGVDLMVKGDITKKPKKNMWYFLELNASPGFHNFSELNIKAYTRIEKLYKQILKDIKSKKLGF